MRKVRLSPSARDDLADILKNVTRQSGSLTIAERAVRTIRERCGTLASLPGTMGRARDELLPGIRSVTEGNFVILFRYASNCIEVLAVLDGRRDVDGLMEERLRSAFE